MIDISAIDYKSPKFQKIVGTVVLAAVVMYLWYSQSYKANKETIETKTKNLEDLRLELQRAKGSVVKVEELRAELERLFAQYKLIEELLPDKRDVPDFINKIYLAAKQADAVVKKIEQKPSQQLGYYTADPYNIEIETTFHGLGKFLSLVANLPFTALVKSVKLRASGSKKYSISVSMVITAHHMERTQRIMKIEELKRKRPKAPKKGKKPRRKAKRVPS